MKWIAGNCWSNPLITNRFVNELDLVDIFDCPSFKNSLGVLKLNKQLKINSDLFKSNIYDF